MWNPLLFNEKHNIISLRVLARSAVSGTPLISKAHRENTSLI